MSEREKPGLLHTGATGHAERNETERRYKPASFVRMDVSGSGVSVQATPVRATGAPLRKREQSRHTCKHGRKYERKCEREHGVGRRQGPFAGGHGVHYAEEKWKDDRILRDSLQRRQFHGWGCGIGLVGHESTPIERVRLRARRYRASFCHQSTREGL